MKSKRVCLAMLVFLSLVLGKAGSAQELQPLEPAWLRQMYSEGWQKVQEGVLQRDTGGGRFETFGYGAEGLQWLAQSYEQQLRLFEEKYDATPTDEIAALIDQLRDKVDSLNGEIQQATSAESFDGSVMEGCTISYDATVYAGPLTSAQGVTAVADAYFHNNCNFLGNTTAYTFAQAFTGTVESYQQQVDPKNNGTWIDSHASASATGSTGCESRAQASVEISSLGIYYAAPEAVNYSCPNVEPVVAAISGPATVTTDYYSPTCANVTWTASATGGQPGGYTYNWYIGTDPTVQGTGSTFTKSYCNTSQSVTVKVVASDSGGKTDDATFTTTISHKGVIAPTISGPTSVSSSTSCTTVSWTVSASSTGHSGFSYQWYIGTTLQTTGTTFSKQFCSTDGASQSVTVKATATASDGHQESVTRTTSITFPPPPPLAVSISGTPDEYIYTRGGCVDVTWTANASGGTPSYTYSWYLGTSTTVQGTASSLTKRFCGAQTINAKVTVKDSAAKTASATYTTTIYWEAPEPICDPICP